MNEWMNEWMKWNEWMYEWMKNICPFYADSIVF